MSYVFPSASGVVAVNDNTRSELILLEIDGEGSYLFTDMYIMNFESSDKADYMINKNLGGSFTFTSFGHSATTLVISGFQASGIEISSDNMKTAQQVAQTKDAETLYRSYCIASANPKLIKVTTGTSNIVTEGSVYRGYMVAFAKKPMGEDKIQGYGFSITMLCERVGGDSNNQQDLDKAMAQSKIDLYGDDADNPRIAL